MCFRSFCWFEYFFPSFRWSSTFQTWASATPGQSFNSKSFSGGTELWIYFQRLYAIKFFIKRFFCRDCPKSRSSVCPDYLNRLHDFLGVDPSNLRMAGVKTWIGNVSKIISIFRWSAFCTSTQWSWILILWQWSYMFPGISFFLFTEEIDLRKLTSKCRIIFFVFFSLIRVHF